MNTVHSCGGYLFLTDSLKFLKVFRISTNGHKLPYITAYTLKTLLNRECIGIQQNQTPLLPFPFFLATSHKPLATNPSAPPL